MAYDKIIVIHSRLDRCLDYVQNDGKTDLGDAVDYICNPAKAGFRRQSTVRWISLFADAGNQTALG